MNPGGDNSSTATAAPAAHGIAEILARFHDGGDRRILIVAHRGGYLSEQGAVLPENSLPAIESSIAAGVEILELDVRCTRDRQLVLMHDSTVSRTTTGRGAVSAMSLAEIRALRLRGTDGVATSLRVPTFAEAMVRAKGKAMVNLDKLEVTDPVALAAAMEILRTTDTLDHALFKGSAPASAAKAALGSHPEEIRYMPVLTDTSAQAVLSALETLRPPAVELIFSSAATPMLSPAVLSKAHECDCRIWINSMWPHLNGGHDDSLAIRGDPDSAWGWIVGKGAGILQTDYPADLAAYLQHLGRRGSG